MEKLEYKKQNIVICTTSFNQSNIDKKLLEKKNLTLKFNPYRRKLLENELMNLIDKQTVGIISGTETITEKVLEKAKNLKVISRCGAGIDNIKFNIRKNKIKVLTTKNIHALAVAEYTLMQILSALKKNIDNNNNLKNGIWKKINGRNLSKKIIGLIGYGNVGKKLKKLLCPFDCKFNIYDPKIKRYSGRTRLNVLLKKSDIITIHIPFSKKNVNFIGAKELTKLKKDSILINSSRGGIINEMALEKKLKINSNFTAILDCFDNEPYKGKLLKYKNIILSPHIASFTNETRNLMEKISLKNCIENI